MLGAGQREVKGGCRKPMLHAAARHILPAPGFPQASTAVENLWKWGFDDDRDLGLHSQTARAQARPEGAQDLVRADAPARARRIVEWPGSHRFGAVARLRRLDPVPPR